MKFKIWSVLAVFILVLIISSTAANAYLDNGQNKFRGPGLEWLLKYVEKPYTLNELNRIFRARDHRLSMYFVKGKFDKIGKFYGPGGVVLTHDKDLIHGGDNIMNYFKDLKDKAKVEVVSFEAVEVFIDLDEHLAEKKDGLRTDKVYTIHEVIYINFDMETYSPVELSSSTSYYHSRRTFR